MLIAAKFGFDSSRESPHDHKNRMIKRLKVRDFKSIREIDLELDPVTVLVGRSGTGKSNIMQAIRFLRNYLLNQQQAINFEFGWDRIFPVTEKNPTTAIEVVFDVPGEDKVYAYRIGFELPGSTPIATPLRLAEEKLTLGDQILFSRRRSPRSHQSRPGMWHWETPPRVVPEPGHSEEPMIGKFPSLQSVVFAFAALSTGIGYYHFPSSVLGFHRGQEHGDEFLKTLPGLSDSASNYRQVMQGIAQDFRNPGIRKNLLASLQAVNPSVASLELDSLTNPQSVIVAHKAGDNVFPLTLEQESDGFRRFYAHLLAIYQTPPKLVLAFEEPENAVFPGALSLLAEEFKSLANQSRGQVILTTQSPLFLDSFDVESVRAVEMVEGKTIVGPVSKSQREAVRDRLLTTGELLTVDKARLDDPR